MESVKIILVICTLTMLFCAGCMQDGQPVSPDTPVPTVTPMKTQTIRVDTPATTTTLPVPTGNFTVSPVTTPADSGSFNPLPLGSPFLFGNGTRWTSDAAVNRVWINDTYRWYNPENLQYDTRVAPAGKKYLIVFLSMVNRRTERAPLPPRGNIYVICDNAVISPYSLHPLPMENPDSTPRIARIAEIEYSHKLYSSELVEDYGYSHGQRLGYIMPGESNAVEGYIIYEVPASTALEKTYVTIVLPDQSKAVWVLG
jgi:hypothetical protein